MPCYLLNFPRLVVSSCRPKYLHFLPATLHSELTIPGMTESSPSLYFSRRGRISYVPGRSDVAGPLLPERLPDPPCRPRQRRPHSIHITRFAVGFVPQDLQPPKPSKKESKLRKEFGRLASKENAKRVWGTVFAPFYSVSPTTSSSASNSTRSVSLDLSRSNRNSLLAAPSDIRPAISREAATSPQSDNVDYPCQAIPNDQSFPSISGNMTTFPPPTTRAPSIESEKPICSGNGVSCSIILAEPVIFLTGYDHDGTTRDSQSNSSAILRGKLQLNVTKSVKIKSVTLTFTGKARTDWPEGTSREFRHKAKLI